MKVLSIESRDIHVTFELPIAEIEKLLIALGLSKIEYDGKDKTETEAAMYLEKTFFPELARIMQEMKNES